MTSAPLPRFAISDGWAVEDAGPPAVFTVSLTPAPAEGQSAWVKVVTANSTATAGSDYVAVPLTTLTFGPGESSKTVPVTVLADTLREGNERFYLKLSKALGGVLADTQGQAFIADEEGLPTVSIGRSRAS